MDLTGLLVQAALQVLLALQDLQGIAGLQVNPAGLGSADLPDKAAYLVLRVFPVSLLKRVDLVQAAGLEFPGLPGSAGLPVSLAYPEFQERAAYQDIAVLLAVADQAGLQVLVEYLELLVNLVNLVLLDLAVGLG